MTTPTFADDDSDFLALIDGRRFPEVVTFVSVLAVFQFLVSSSDKDISSDDRSVVSAFGSSESLEDFAAFFIDGRPLAGVVCLLAGVLGPLVGVFGPAVGVL